MHAITMRALAIVIVLLIATSAHAYPQFQLGRDITCTGCHNSPDGGGLLNENGYGVLESIALRPMTSSFMYGKVPTPDWLQLGGDVRGAAGVFENKTLSPGAF